METRLRSLVKSLTWRVLGIVILAILAWIFTGSWEQTTLITVTFHTIRVVLYYFHERLWLRIRWGIVKYDYKGIKQLYPKVRKKIGERISAFIALMRPFTILGAIIAGFSLNYYFSIVSGTPTTFLQSLIIGLVLGFLQAGGQALNQGIIEEILIDRINGKTYRPTVKGLISPDEALVFATYLFLAGITLAFCLNFQSGFIAILIALFAITYSAPPLRVKKFFLVNNIHQGIARGLLPALYVSSLYGCQTKGLLFGIPLAIWVTGAQASKDFGDEKGDKKFGIMTFPVKLGREKALKLMWILMIASFSLYNIMVGLLLVPLKFVILNILVLPSIFIVYALKRDIKTEKMENNLGWVAFYGTLSLFYLLSPLLA